MTRPTDIKLIISDVDGVWTDGRIIYTSGGDEIKAFNVRDGLGVKLAQRVGIAVALLTSRQSPVIDRRAKELGIVEVHQGAANKLVETENLVQRLGLSFDQIAYIGDDLPDLAPMARAAISAAPSDAEPDVLAAATWPLQRPGGRGAFRELVDRLLHERGDWDAVRKEFAIGKPDAASI